MAQRQAFQGGGKDASTKSFSKSYDRQSVAAGLGDPNTRGNYNKTTTFNQDSGQVVANLKNAEMARNRAAAVRQEAIKKDIINRELEKSNYGAPKNVFDNFGAWANKQRQKAIQKTIRRNKYSNLKELDALEQRSRFPGFVGTAIDAINVDPETDMFDTESPREIAAQLSKFNSLTPTQSKSIGDLQQDIAMENNPNISQSEFDKYMNRNKIVTREGNPNILPEYAMMGGGAELGGDDAVEDVTYDWHLGKGGQKTGRDVTLGYLASGGRARRAEGGIMGLRARKAFGGIMDRVTGRKAYGLGSIFKSVKKAVGKVLKSPIGKAAVIGLGGYYLGGGQALGGSKMFGTKFGKDFALKNLAKRKGFSLLTGGGKDGKYDEGFNPWKVAGLAMTAAPFIPGPWNKVKPNESLGMAERGGHLIDPITGKEALPSQMRASLNNALDNADGDPIRIKQINDAYAFLGPDERLGTYLPYRTYGVKDGGRIGKAEGGLMDLGGMEKDYRAEGGFVPIGAKEKADDVPARLSVNEFVFTADAVRNAGGGDIDQGAEVMENVMKNLEAGGKISAETQGNTGAQEMFSVSERLGEVI